MEHEANFEAVIIRDTPLPSGVRDDFETKLKLIEVTDPEGLMLGEDDLKFISDIKSFFNNKLFSRWIGRYREVLTAFYYEYKVNGLATKPNLDSVRNYLGQLFLGGQKISTRSQFTNFTSSMVRHFKTNGYFSGFRGENHEKLLFICSKIDEISDKLVGELKES